MTTEQILTRVESGIEEVSFAGNTHIQTPVYSPEIKSDEDLTVLLRHGDALDDGAPIVVPSYKWRSIRSQKKFSDLTPQIEELVRSSPILYRSPVELFRYRRPQQIVSYGLGGDTGRSRRFYKKLRDEKYDDALGMLPKFIQPFVEIQMERLLEVKDYPVPPRYEGTLRSTTEAWTDSRVNKEWPNYFADIVKDAQKSPDAGVVAPVPPITEGSNEQTIDRLTGANQGMVRTCREVNEGHFGSPVYPYLHVYADYTILKSTTNVDRKLNDGIRREIKDRAEESSFTDIGDGGVGYQGIVLTISNLENVWGRNMVMRLEQFVEGIKAIADEHDLPVIMPRSGWHGLYLTDSGVNTFSSLLNGNEKYSQRSDGISTEAMYGKTPFYGNAIHPSVSDAFNALQRKGGSVHPIPSLPDRPPAFNPSASTWEGRLGDPEDYRVDFGKARRLIHAQEAREVRQGKQRGTVDPAKQYLKTSDNNDFS